MIVDTATILYSSDWFSNLIENIDYHLIYRINVPMYACMYFHNILMTSLLTFYDVTKIRIKNIANKRTIVQSWVHWTYFAIFFFLFFCCFFFVFLKAKDLSSLIFLIFLIVPLQALIFPLRAMKKITEYENIIQNFKYKQILTKTWGMSNRRSAMPAGPFRYV